LGTTALSYLPAWKSGLSSVLHVKYTLPLPCQKFTVSSNFSFRILVTAIGDRPKPEICFFPRRLKWTLLPKERYGESLSGRGSNTQPTRGGHFTIEQFPLSG